jgi:addiction module HigA family antidote
MTVQTPHPGVVLAARYMAPRGISQNQLARALSVSPRRINLLVHGQRSVTAETAILRNFANHSIVKNNIVQTVASAAGTLSAIIFVLPGLIMIGWWTGFPYWITVAVCAVGGIRIIALGSLVSAGFGLLANLKVLANSVAAYLRVGAGSSIQHRRVVTPGVIRAPRTVLISS